MLSIHGAKHTHTMPSVHETVRSRLNTLAQNHNKAKVREVESERLEKGLRTAGRWEIKRYGSFGPSCRFFGDNDPECKMAVLLLHAPSPSPTPAFRRHADSFPPPLRLRCPMILSVSTSASKGCRGGVGDLLMWRDRGGGEWWPRYGKGMGWEGGEWKLRGWECLRLGVVLFGAGGCCGVESWKSGGL